MDVTRLRWPAPGAASRTATAAKLVGDRPDVHLVHGDCNEALLEQVFPHVLWEDYRRGLCLLDPYGLDLSWTVIQTAGQQRTIDLFVNFPIMDANRNALWRDPERVPPAQAGRLTTYWGDESWRTSAYRPKNSSRARRTWPTGSSATSSRSTHGGPKVARSSIEWTEATWNPTTGCDKISPGCKHCYAEVMARRLRAMGQSNYRNGFELTLHPAMLDRPLQWRRPLLVFVNSMSDLFHEDVPLAFLRKVFDVMRRASWHTFQVLTKRAERLEELAPLLHWPENVWMGVSVEREDYGFRIRHLQRTPARVRFLSLEPLLG